MHPQRFITATEALKEDYKGRTNYWVCRPEVCEARDLQICRAVLPAGEGHNFHTHPELEEVIYVLEGHVEQWVEKEKRLLGPGESPISPGASSTPPSIRPAKTPPSSPSSRPRPPPARSWST